MLPFLKQHTYTSADHGVDFFSDVADYELFSVHDPLSDEKSKLKISYVNKTFQKKTEPCLLSACLHYKRNIFFANDLFYVKNTENQRSPCNVRSSHSNG